jgi:hypothetical protein
MPRRSATASTNRSSRVGGAEPRHCRHRHLARRSTETPGVLTSLTAIATLGRSNVNLRYFPRTCSSASGIPAYAEGSCQPSEEAS